MRCLAMSLLLGLALPGLMHAQEPEEPVDSTYLRLVLDLPVASAFSYEVLGSTSRAGVFYQIRHVEVERCTLSFEILQQTPRHWISTFDVPLKALDPKSLSIGVAHPPRNARLEPQPWLLRLAVRPDSEARIVTGTLERPDHRTTRRIDLMFKDFQTAASLKAWLLDAANRCDTWHTAPMKAIR